MKNHPFIVWSTCFLWFTAILSVIWSFILFFCLGDLLVLTGLELVNSFVLLSGIIMIPMNTVLLYYIANGKKIRRDFNVICCPLWLCIVWIIMIDAAAASLCIKRIFSCRQFTDTFIQESMRQYRTSPKYKRFMDNLQWTLRCCGLESYKDWYSYDWYDKIRDYEWDPSSNSQRQTKEISTVATDSVPLRCVGKSNCCKSGSCIFNYLKELGTHSINTRGCGIDLHNFAMTMLICHLLLFILVIIDEILVLKFIMRQDRPCSNSVSQSNPRRFSKDVHHIMTAKEDFAVSSPSTQLNPDDSDEDSPQ